MRSVLWGKQHFQLSLLKQFCLLKKMFSFYFLRQKEEEVDRTGWDKFGVSGLEGIYCLDVERVGINFCRLVNVLGG